MCFKDVLKIGFKVLVAAATGLVIYSGIDRISNNNDGGKKKRGCQERTNSLDDLSGNVTGEPEKINEDGFIQKLKNIQGTFGKLFAIAQSITFVADNFRRIFAGPEDNSGYYIGQQSYYNNDPWYNNSYNGRGNTGKVYINRLSPFVMEVVDDRDYRGI